MKRRHFLLALMASPLGRQALAVDFAPVLAGRTLRFPADHGAHPDFRTEWWYATGWLRLPDGSPLGFQTTFFRVRTRIGDDNPSRFAPRQLGSHGTRAVHEQVGGQPARFDAVGWSDDSPAER